MICVLFVSIAIIILLVGIGIIISFMSKRSKYLGFEDDKIKFFMMKHALFRLCALYFICLHYFLLVSAVIFTLITVYMIVDENIGKREQVFYLVMAAIFSTLSNTIKLNDIANVYFEAMRKLETAILTYKKYEEEHDEQSNANDASNADNNANHDISILIEANKEAEALIGEKFL